MMFFTYNIRVNNRDNLKGIFDNDITTEIHYPIAPHDQKAYRTYFTTILFLLVNSFTKQQ